MKRIFLAVIACMALLASFFTAFGSPVTAKTAFSNPAASLVVNIINPDGTTTLVYEYTGVVAGTYSPDRQTSYNYYTYPELEALAGIYYYATVDAMPAAVGTKALGVTINTLVNDAKKYNPDLKWESGQCLRLYPTDAAGYPYQGVNYYNYDFIQGQTRYYYPNLVEAYTQYRENGEDQSYLEHALDNPIPVEPVIALSSFQERYTTNAMLTTTESHTYGFGVPGHPDYREIVTPVQLDSKESFRFCMGLTTSEAMQGIANQFSSTNKFCRWVYQIDIGPVKGPSLVDDRTDNNPGQPIEITFTDNAAWRSAVTGVIVNGTTLDTSLYSITSGKIVFNETVFTTSGSYEVIVTADGYLNTKVTQSIKELAAISVTGVTLNKTSLDIPAGNSEQLTATVAPADAANKDVTWSTNNAAVASVSNGLVTALSAGTATITVTTADGGKKATCIVTVTVINTGGGGVVVTGGETAVQSLKSIELNGLTTGEPVRINGQGVIQGAAQITTTDEKMTIAISDGTKLLAADNTTLAFLEIAVPDSLPEPPAGAAFVLAYELGPAGATFNPPLNLKITYDSLPPDMKEETIRIVYWNGLSWENVEGILDTVNKTVSANISHFSNYAVAADIFSPARFTFTGLNLTPDRIHPGETVAVKVVVTNQGEMAGSCQVRLDVDDIEQGSQETLLEPGQEQVLSFHVRSDEPGEHIVTIGEKRGKFVVEIPPEDIPAQTSEETPVSVPETTALLTETDPAPESDTALPDEDTQTPPFWPVIVGAAAGFIAVLAILTFIFRRRKTSAGPGKE